MTTTTKPTRKTKKKPAKRGPKEERLVIHSDPVEALAKLLRTKKKPRP